MALVLKIAGGIWAALGLGNILLSPAMLAGGGLATFTVIFNFVAFILPGLAVYGIGAMISGRGDAGRVNCPFCAERILPAAKVCPHCRKDLPLTATEDVLV